MTKSIFLAVVLAASPALGEDPPESGPAAPNAACAAAATEKVQARYDGISDLTGSFVQRTRNVAFGGDAEPDSASGRVVFAKPGRMRWEYEKPEPSLVVSDGNVLWIYDPVAGEAQKLTVDAGYLSGAAIQFLIGDGKILDSFEVEARECNDSTAQLELTPREASTYERIDLVVELATGWILATTVHDLFGNRTEVAFADLRANEGAPAERFQFDPPDGVRVLSLEAPKP